VLTFAFFPAQSVRSTQTWIRRSCRSLQESWNQGSHANWGSSRYC